MPPPPGHMGVQRAADDPPARLIQPADLPPGRPGLGEGLRHEVLAQRPVAHADHGDPQAVIPGRRVELRELALNLVHALYTFQELDSSTSPVYDSSDQRSRESGPSCQAAVTRCRVARIRYWTPVHHVKPAR